MRDDIQSAFGQITAEPALVANTKEAVLKKAPKAQTRGFMQKLVYAACAAAAALVLTLAGIAYCSSAAYISIDVNPSVELELNRFGNVIAARPLNEDAERVLSGVNIMNRSYEYALDAILGVEILDGYINDKAVVLVAVQSDDPAMQDSVLKKVEQTAKTAESGGALARCITVDAGTKEEAKSYGVSAGKYSAIKQLQQKDPTATVEKYKDSSMNEILGWTDNAPENSAASNAPEVAESQAPPAATATAAPAAAPTAKPANAPAKEAKRPEKTKEPIKAEAQGGGKDSKAEPDGGSIDAPEQGGSGKVPDAGNELAAGGGSGNGAPSTEIPGNTTEVPGGASEDKSANDVPEYGDTQDGDKEAPVNPGTDDSMTGGLGGEENAQSEQSGGIG